MKRARQIAAVPVLCGFLFLIGVTLRGSACSYSSNPTKIGRNFSVQVLSQGSPIAGLQIELITNPSGEQEIRSLLTKTTDESGFSEFINVKPGPYFVGIKHAAFPQSVEIVVDPRHAENLPEKITFEWPQEKRLSTRSISGLLNAAIRTENPLNDQARPTFGALGGAKLTLSRAVSGEVVEAQMATESGGFGFQMAPAGLYTLRVEMPKDSSRYRGSQDGYIPIEIDPAAKISTLNLFLYPGICGSLGYDNRQEAPTE